MKVSVNPPVTVKSKLPLPPLPMTVVFLMVNLANLALVKVQAMFAPAVVAEASKVTLPSAKLGVAVPPAPKPVQLMAVTL